jgi:hypothetical protein
MASGWPPSMKARCLAYSQWACYSYNDEWTEVGTGSKTSKRPGRTSLMTRTNRVSIPGAKRRGAGGEGSRGSER